MRRVLRLSGPSGLVQGVPRVDGPRAWASDPRLGQVGPAGFTFPPAWLTATMRGGPQLRPFPWVGAAPTSVLGWADRSGRPSFPVVPLRLPVPLPGRRSLRCNLCGSPLCSLVRRPRSRLGPVVRPLATRLLLRPVVKVRLFQPRHNALRGFRTVLSRSRRCRSLPLRGRAVVDLSNLLRHVLTQLQVLRLELQRRLKQRACFFQPARHLQLHAALQARLKLTGRQQQEGRQ